jgi:hypothetical protein
LDRDKNASHVHGDKAVEVFQRELIDGRERDDPRVVHEDVEATKNFHRLGDGVFHALDIGAVGAYGPCLTTGRFDGAHHLVGFLRRGGVGKRDGCPIRSQSFSDRGPDAARSAGHECDFVGQFL